MGRSAPLALLLTLVPAMGEEWKPDARNFVIFGPPGVGKGTQSANLVQRHGVCHVSTGDLLRAEIGQGTRIGKRVRKVIEAGGLVPDSLMIRMVKRRLDRVRACQRNGWLLDGFPRTPGQARAMIAAGLLPHHIIVLNASAATATSRALERARESAATGKATRKDDNEATLRARFVAYERNQAATLATLRSYLRFAVVDAEQTKQNVSAAIESAMGERRGHER